MLKVSEQKAIREYVNELCDFLMIKPVICKFVTANEGFATKTTRACVDVEERCIYYNVLLEYTEIETVFNTAHEVRHIWQMENKTGVFFNSYKTSAECSSLEEYNLQPEEVDAHAFAMIEMVDMFGVKPLFENFSDRVRKAILNRAKEILAEEYTEEAAEEILVKLLSEGHKIC